MSAFLFQDENQEENIACGHVKSKILVMIMVNIKGLKYGVKVQEISEWVPKIVNDDDEITDAKGEGQDDFDERSENESDDGGDSEHDDEYIVSEGIIGTFEAKHPSIDAID